MVESARARQRTFFISPYVQRSVLGASVVGGVYNKPVFMYLKIGAAPRSSFRLLNATPSTFSLSSVALVIDCYG